jgi:Fe-S oxidoreductase
MILMDWTGWRGGERPTTPDRVAVCHTAVAAEPACPSLVRPQAISRWPRRQNVMCVLYMRSVRSRLPLSSPWTGWA